MHVSGQPLQPAADARTSAQRDSPRALRPGGRRSALTSRGGGGGGGVFCKLKLSCGVIKSDESTCVVFIETPRKERFIFVLWCSDEVQRSAWRGRYSTVYSTVAHVGVEVILYVQILY